MKKEFDYIVVGGGSGGCVLAARLTEDSKTDLCLLEAGGKGDSLVVNTPPGAVLMVPGKVNNWAFESVPQAGINGRKSYQPRGKALGGSSAINAMVYIRGHREDYDRWASEEGCDGWSYKEVLPYFKLAENNERIQDNYHGQGGPLNVSDLRSDNPFQKRFLNAAKEAGLPLTDDFNGANQEGAGLYQVTQKNGERCSAAKAYLFPVMHRPNLTVHTKAMVKKVLFEGKRAVGVLVELAGETVEIRARKEVLLAAGALQTPQLLMVSGVGDSSHLATHGIKTIHHLPQVGKNLQDHPDFIFGYKSRSLDLVGLSIRGFWQLIKAAFLYRKYRRGLLTSNFAEGGAFLKTSPSKSHPDVQLHFVIALVEDHARKMHYGHGFSCHVCLLRPKSRGSVRLAGPSMSQPPELDIGIYKNPQDLEDMVAGYKLTDRLMKTHSLSRWATKDTFTSQIRTDDDIRQILRERSDTVYHPVGSCRMGSDPHAVVDTQLRVNGLEGLRIVDASVFPSLVSGNTNAPVIMLAEKASDLIKGKSRIAQANLDTMEA